MWGFFCLFWTQFLPCQVLGLYSVTNSLQEVLPVFFQLYKKFSMDRKHISVSRKDCVYSQWHYTHNLNTALISKLKASAFWKTLPFLLNKGRLIRIPQGADMDKCSVQSKLNEHCWTIQFFLNVGVACTAQAAELLHPVGRGCTVLHTNVLTRKQNSPETWPKGSSVVISR